MARAVCAVLATLAVIVLVRPSEGQSCSLTSDGQLPRVTGVTSTSCSPSEAGRLRYVTDRGVAQACTGSEWQDLTTSAPPLPPTTQAPTTQAPTTTPEAPTTPEAEVTTQPPTTGGDHPTFDMTPKNGGRPLRDSCLSVKNFGESLGSGAYYLRQSGTTFLAYCDMETEGGGWTLFAAKRTPSFRFLSQTFNSAAARAVTSDGAGCIPTSSYSQVMFRFAHDSAANRVVYHRYSGGGDKERFNRAVQCGAPLSGGSNRPCPSVGGFHRHSSIDNYGARIPGGGYHEIFNLCIEPLQHGITESHMGSNMWIEMWDSMSTEVNLYHPPKDAAAYGMKCLSGMCHSDKTIWLMYR